jgi:hypothetical protein
LSRCDRSLFIRVSHRVYDGRHLKDFDLSTECGNRKKRNILREFCL